jgi:hypothetical protein
MSAQHTYDVGEILYTQTGEDRWECWKFEQRSGESPVYGFRNDATRERLEGTVEDLLKFRKTDERVTFEDYEYPGVYSREIPECSCEMFAQNYAHLGSGDVLAATHGMTPPEIAPFRFCPWCGQQLTIIRQTTFHHYVNMSRWAEAISKDPIPEQILKAFQADKWDA